jgi:hypothetical protein
LLCNTPLLNEPGVNNGHYDIKSYNEIINFANIDIAICDIIEKKEYIYMPFFENFYPFIKENFIKNYDKLIEISDKKNQEHNSVSLQLKTGFYGMNVNINYKKLIEKLKESKLIAEIM